MRIFQVLATVAALVIAPSLAARAEPLPLPTVDFESQATIINDGKLLLRHSRGKMRIEMTFPGIGEPVTGIVDLARKKIVFTVPIPGLAKTAVEVDFGDELAFGQIVGNAERVGNATVAGEPCTLWKASNAQGSAVTCLAQDNIPLKTEATIDGKQRVVFEVTDVKRQPQNPSDFELPAGTNIIKVPKGFKGVPGIPGLN